MNEELQTVNSELKNKLENISTAHSDLRNLTAATEIGTLFLDSDLRIRMFTPPVAELFNITEADVGREITHFTHRLRYDDIEQDARRVLSTLSPIELEIEDRRGRWFMLRLRPYRTVEDRINGVVLTFVDITNRLETERRLAESKERYQNLFENIDEGFILAEVLYDESGEPVDVRYVEANPAAVRLTDRELVGRSLSQIESGFESYWLELPARVAKTGVAERGEYYAAPLQRWFDVGITKVDENRVAILFQDITARRHHDTQREMLAHELSHRVKNVFAVLQALASLTTGATIEDYRKVFLGRLRALSDAHSLLLDRDWQSADLGKLLQEATAAYKLDNGSRIFIEGPDVTVSPQQALGLGLVIHELGTNALKYGSLSGSGSVEVTWQVERTEESSSQVHLSWRERGGPPVEAPEAEGFGMQLIKQACVHELNGEAALTFNSDGLVCEIRFSLS